MTIGTGVEQINRSFLLDGVSYAECIDWKTGIVIKGTGPSTNAKHYESMSINTVNSERSGRTIDIPVIVGSDLAKIFDDYFENPTGTNKGGQGKVIDCSKAYVNGNLSDRGATVIIVGPANFPDDTYNDDAGQAVLTYTFDCRDVKQK